MVGPSTVWETRNLREVVTKLVDGSHNPPPKQETGLPMLSARNIDRGQVLFDDYRLISESAFVSENARTRIAAGDVLLTIVGTIGRTAVVPDGSQPFALQRSVAVLTPAANVLPKFLCYQLQSPAIQRHFEANARGTAQKGVYLKTLGQTPIVLPPIDVQTEVVAEIEKQFSRLDEAVANLQRVKANLKRYKASVLKDAVEGRLVPTEAELARREGRSFETGEQLLLQILETRRNRWSGRGKFRTPDAPERDASKLPDGWTWSSIDQLADVGTGATPNRSKSEYWVDGDVPWVTSGVANGDYVDRASEFVTQRALAETNLTVYPAGTLLVAMYGEGKTRGKCAELRISATTNQAVAALQVNEQVRAFVRHFLELNYEEMRKVASGGVQPNLNLSLVRAVAIPLPPLAEQIRIAAEVDRRLSLVYGVAAEIDTGLKRANALRQQILSLSFTR